MVQVYGGYDIDWSTLAQKGLRFEQLSEYPSWNAELCRWLHKLLNDNDPHFLNVFAAIFILFFNSFSDKDRSPMNVLTVAIAFMRTSSEMLLAGNYFFIVLIVFKSSLLFFNQFRTEFTLKIITGFKYSKIAFIKQSFWVKIKTIW